MRYFLLIVLALFPAFASAETVIVRRNSVVITGAQSQRADVSCAEKSLAFG